MPVHCLVRKMAIATQNSLSAFIFPFSSFPSFTENIENYSNYANHMKKKNDPRLVYPAWFVCQNYHFSASILFIIV